MEVEDKNTQLQERDTQINRQQRELDVFGVRNARTSITFCSCDIINLVS